jgi:hypothetical protein
LSSILTSVGFWCAPLFAEVQRQSYEFARIREASDPRLMLVAVVLVTLGILLGVGLLYRRDTQELSVGMRWGLLLLRCTALAGLLFFFLDLQKRTTREIIADGEVVVLVDVSQSMGITDEPLIGPGESSARYERVAAALGESPLLDELREGNNVIVSGFDSEVVRLAMLDRKAALVDRGETVVIPADSSEQQRYDWVKMLQPRGAETRVGDALRQELEMPRQGSLAGIVLISDGVENAGSKAVAAAELAQTTGVPIFAIGIGSVEPQRSVLVSDLVAPRRAFPGDLLTVTAHVQGSGFAGRAVQAELTCQPAGDPTARREHIASERITLGENSQLVPIHFELESPTVGRFKYVVEIGPLAGDTNREDNRREVEVDIVDRKTRVLLIAGGPSRDYRFLRTLLFRDHSMEVDVLLQSALSEISQEADRILNAFPKQKNDLYEYDCIVAIDPDWTKLDAAQIELLDGWVASEAGGLVATAGPVETARWIRSTEHAALKSLYPVEFQRRFTLLDDGHFAGEIAWPIELDRAGWEAEFLWLEGTRADSLAAWQSWPGVYGFFAVKGPKRGATVYGRFADPEFGSGENQPVYFAGHFYGAGRVFYLGSPEMWRLRTVDPAYFDTFYTKVIRHVSQGRLLRGSSRGALMVERDRVDLGETVVVRARLTDQQYEPLMAASTPVQLIRPDELTELISLTALADQPGVFVGQFSASQAGIYEIVLTVPGQFDQQLTRQIEVRATDLERLAPERNSSLLAAVADVTGGAYYPELTVALQGDADVLPVAARIPDRTEVRVLDGAPDEKFARAQVHWLLGVICAALFLEWIIRRLCRLA